MKKFIKYAFIITLPVLFLIGMSSNVFAYDDGDKIVQPLESGGMISDPVRIIQIVRYPERGANHSYVSAGDVMIWDTISEDGVTVNYVQATDITTSSDAVAGVAVGLIPTADSAGTVTSDVGKRNWGYIQIYGYNELVKVDGTGIVVGGGLLAGPVRGQASAAKRDTTGEFSSHGSLGFAYNASATAGNAKVFIRIQ